MRDGAGNINKAASIKYRTLDREEKDRLTNSVSSFIDEAVTVKDVKKTGAKIFKKIQKLVSYSYLHNIDEIGSS